jgi:hypothetical protein
MWNDLKNKLGVFETSNYWHSPLIVSRQIFYGTRMIHRGELMNMVTLLAECCQMCL